MSYSECKRQSPKPTWLVPEYREWRRKEWIASRKAYGQKRNDEGKNTGGATGL